MEREDQDWISKSITDMGSGIKELMNEKFKHLEGVLKDFKGDNYNEHIRMSKQIGELYEENKRDRLDVDNKIQGVVEEFEAKHEAHNRRISGLEQRQSKDEGAFSGKEMSNKQMIAIIGLMFAGVEILQIIFNAIGGTP